MRSLDTFTMPRSASSVPLLTRPIVSTTVEPVNSSNFLLLNFKPISFATSTMFKTSSNGCSSSINCAVKYRLRSRLDASTTLAINSGFSLMITLRAANSSRERAVKEYVPGKSMISMS